MFASVVIPVRNGARYIGEAIQSALQQPRVRRVIVVDDGSTDRSADIAREIDDQRVVLVVGPQRGVSAARNIGFAEAEAQDPCSRAGSSWVMFLDADDRLRPHAIDMLFEGIEGDCVAVYGDYDRIDQNGQRVGRRHLLRRRRKPGGDILRALLAGNFVVNGGVMLVRRDIFRSVGGFDETLRYCEDWRVFCRIAAMGSIIWQPRHILDYRVHGASAMMSRPLDFRDCRAALERVFSDPLILAKITPSTASRLRRAAEAHLRTYLACQAIRSGAYLRALPQVSRAVAVRPSGAPVAMIRMLAALAAL